MKAAHGEELRASRSRVLVVPLALRHHRAAASAAIVDSDRRPARLRMRLWRLPASRGGSGTRRAGAAYRDRRRRRGGGSGSSDGFRGASVGCVEPAGVSNRASPRRDHRTRRPGAPRRSGRGARRARSLAALARRWWCSCRRCRRCGRSGTTGSAIAAGIGLARCGRISSLADGRCGRFAISSSRCSHRHGFAGSWACLPRATSSPRCRGGWMPGWAGRPPLRTASGGGLPEPRSPRWRSVADRFVKGQQAARRAACRGECIVAGAIFGQLGCTRRVAGLLRSISAQSMYSSAASNIHRMIGPALDCTIMEGALSPGNVRTPTTFQPEGADSGAPVSAG